MASSWREGETGAGRSQRSGPRSVGNNSPGPGRSGVRARRWEQATRELSSLCPGRKLDAGLKELALGGLCAEAMARQRRQDSGDVLQVFFQRPRVNAGVVDELTDVSRVDVLPQHIGNIVSERCRSVRQSELHYPKLELPKRHRKRRLVPVRFRDWNLPIAPQQVNLCEILAVPSLVEEILWMRQWKSILDGLRI
eukprot:3216962-Rhodomonas_salina.1